MRVAYPSQLTAPADNSPLVGLSASAGATPLAPAALPITSGAPVPPTPFDMAKWRKEWGLWWSVANREAIRAALGKVG